MLEIAVIADDITGAADTGVQFLPDLAPVYLLDHRALFLEALDDRPRGISVYTNSRGLTAGEAARAVWAASHVVYTLNPRRVYKKIDSALRGHIGAELEAALDALKLPHSFIAPAFPEQNRTTVEGIHRIHGVPVAETEIGRDPVAPVTKSYLPGWVGAQTRRPVAHIALKTMDSDLEVIAAEITGQLARGARHISFDAIEFGHLDRIARLALAYFPEALLCGSAGLAGALARQLPERTAPELTRPQTGIRMTPGRVLFVCGSASHRLRRQVALLAEHADVGVETLEPASLLCDDAHTLRAAILDRTAAALARQDLVLQLPAPGIEPEAVDPQRLAARLSEFAVTLINRVKPAGLFLSGGDTAVAVLERLRAKAVRLERQIPGGLVVGIITGGLMSGRPVVTKAGSFGSPNALLDLHCVIRQD